MMNITIESNTPLRTPPSDYCPPGSARWFTIPEGYDAGKKMFYYDYVVGKDNPKAAIVFVHGNPETSYTYRHIRNTLIASKASMRIIAMDHIGFGLSDQASFEMIDMHHTANLRQLIRHLDVTHVILVVHDWGGPTGIGAFLHESSRVEGLLVMNTTLFPMQKEGYTFTNYPSPLLQWSKFPYMVPNFLWGGIAATAVSHGEPQSAFRLLARSLKYMLLHGTGMIAPDSPEYVWAKSLRTTNNAKSSKRNVLQTPHWGYGYQYVDPTHGTQDNRTYYLHMQQEVPAVWGPEGKNIKVCGYFGQWCPCGKDSVIRQWQAALPQMIPFTYTFADVGHFIEEYKGEEMAASILQMIG